MKLEIHYADDWAALYVDGELDRVGDSYLAEEKAFELLGVKVVKDDAFMRGQTRSDGVARTLSDVEAYRVQREEAKATAARLREEAARLAAEADRLERGEVSGV